MIPWQCTQPIATDRLVLRLMTEADIDDVYAYQSDPEVARYQLYEPRTREQVAEKMPETAAATSLEKDDDYIQFAIELPATPGNRARVIGSLFFIVKSFADEAAELGWALHRDFQGKGYAFESASAGLHLAFETLGLHRVFADLDPRNVASVALCLRLGMRHEAHFLENIMFKGDWADTAIYAILDREWRDSTPA